MRWAINELLAMGEGVCRKKKLFTQKGRAELESLGLGPWASYRWQELLRMLDELDRSLLQLDHAVQKQAEQNPEAVRLMTHPGVGPVTSLARRESTRESAAILMSAASEGLSTDDLTIVDEELCGALIGAADYRQQSSQLLARNQAQSAAFGTGEYRPVGVIFFSDAASILQHEDGAGKHLFGDPLA